jgi:hypothetical protein
MAIRDKTHAFKGIDIHVIIIRGIDTIFLSHRV